MWVLSWIDDVPKPNPGCGCLLWVIIVVVLGILFGEAVLQKDIDGDGKICYTWTERVVNSKGLQINEIYYGKIRLKTTASDSYYEELLLTIVLNEDKSFKGSWTNRWSVLWDEQSINGEWDYLLHDDMVYRVLMFEKALGGVNELYVDENLKVVLYDVFEDDEFSGDRFVGAFSTKRP